MSEKEIDITKNIKIIELLKSQLLLNVGELYAKMLDPNQNASTLGEIIADTIVLCYLLGEKLSNQYDVIDVKILNKIKIGLIDNKSDDEWKEQILKLSRHLEKTRRIK